MEETNKELIINIIKVIFRLFFYPFLVMIIINWQFSKVHINFWQSFWLFVIVDLLTSMERSK